MFNDQSFNDTLTNDIVSFEQQDSHRKKNCSTRRRKIKQQGCLIFLLRVEQFFFLWLFIFSPTCGAVLLSMGCLIFLLREEQFFFLWLFNFSPTCGAVLLSMVV